MKTKTNAKARIPAVLTALALTLTLLPMLPAAASAAAGVQAGTPEFAVNTATPTVVGFGGKQWAVIGYDGVNNTTPSNTLTLLLADGQSYGTSQFHGSSNEYSGSILQSAMDSAFDGLQPKEQALVAGRALTGIAGPAVDGAKFWPLSDSEASVVNSAIRPFSNDWWLRSYYLSSYATYVRNNGDVQPVGTNVTNPYAVRPAFNLNIANVAFTSDAAGGKDDAVDAVLSAVTAPTGAVKLTVLDASLNLTSVTQTSYYPATKMVSFRYNGGMTGKTLSAAVERSGAITHYGKLFDGSPMPVIGTASVTLPTGFNPATDKLKIFLEELNADNHTDFCGTPLVLDVITEGLIINGDTDILYTDAGAFQSAMESVLYYTGAAVTGKLTGVQTTLTLNIPAGKTVTWNAEYTGVNTDSTGLIRLTGPGNFNMTGGTVENASTSSASRTIRNYSTGAININGGTVKAASGYAIYNEGTGAINIRGGTVESTPIYWGDTITNTGTGDINISGGTVKTAANGTAISSKGTGDINISGGTVQSASDTTIFNQGLNEINISGGTIQSAAGRAIESLSNSQITISEADASNPTLITSAAPGEDNGTIYLRTGLTPVLNIQGGTVRNTAADGNAVSNRMSGTINITGGTVENTSAGTAVSNRIDGTINVSGGTVRSKTGIAIDNLDHESKTGAASVSGGLVFSYGTALTDIIRGTHSITGGTAVAWDQAAGKTAYTQGTDEHLFSAGASTAAWHRSGGDHGLLYETDKFLKVEGVTVSLPDTAGPALTAGTADRTSGTAAAVRFTSDEAGIFSYQTGGTAPSAASLAMSGHNAAAMTAGTNTFSLSALTPGAHTVYIAARDAAGNVSNLLTVNVPADPPPTEPPPTEPPTTEPPPTEPPSTEPPPTEPPPTEPPPPTPSEEAIGKIKDAEDGGTVTITLPGGGTTLTKEVFEEIAGRDVTLEITAGGVTWIIYGKDVPEDGLKDIDFGADVGGISIPADAINLITGEVKTVQISLSHSGPFGFDIKLKVPLGPENAGFYANLYFYNPVTGILEYRGASVIGGDGHAAFTFTGASDYAVFIDLKDHGASKSKDEPPATDSQKTKPKPLPPFTSAKTDPVEKYVDVLYMGLLARSPDPGGFNYWTGQIKQGNLTAAGAAWHITFSDELKKLGLTDVQFLERLYNGLFGRGPDAGGFDFWAALLGLGVSREAVFNAFAASPEFAERCKALGLVV